MQNNKNNKSKQPQNHGKQKDTVSDFETFPAVGEKKAVKSNLSIPSEEGVKNLKSFVEENKK